MWIILISWIYDYDIMWLIWHWFVWIDWQDDHKHNKHHIPSNLTIFDPRLWVKLDAFFGPLDRHISSKENHHPFWGVLRKKTKPTSCTCEKGWKRSVTCDKWQNKWLNQPLNGPLNGPKIPSGLPVSHKNLLRLQARLATLEGTPVRVQVCGRALSNFKQKAYVPM